MVNYIIRVAYQEAGADTAERLTAELAKYNVANAIKADDGQGYYLPASEFCYSGNEPINEVRDAIQRLADSVQPGASVLVTEAASLSWSNLKLAQATPQQAQQ